jgi:hypothetical protein
MFGYLHTSQLKKEGIPMADATGASRILAWIERGKRVLFRSSDWSRNTNKEDRQRQLFPLS